MNSSVKFLSPMVTAGLPLPGWAALLLVVPPPPPPPHAASASEAITAAQPADATFPRQICILAPPLAGLLELQADADTSESAATGAPRRSATLLTAGPASSTRRAKRKRGADTLTAATTSP